MDLRILKDTPPWEWPDDAAKTFLEVLRDKQADEADRLIAAELAGDSTFINEELAAALLSIVRDADQPEKIRAEAAIALGPVLELGDQEDMNGFMDPDDVPISEKTFRKIRNTLRMVYLDANVPKFVKRRVLEGSVRSPQEWHKEAVRSAYARDDDDWKLTAGFCMGYIPGFDDQILL